MADTMSTALQPGEVVLEKLQVVRSLGHGGMGAVYEVEHRLTRHRRALKVLHHRFASQDDVVTRFIREASAAGTIGSEHIVETYDAGHLPDGRPYVLMELLRGLSLNDVLQCGPRLPPRDACALVRQACQGVAAAHAADIIHRDLKPDNLFLVRRGDSTFVKVLDFGISKFGAGEDEVRLTRSEAVMGTPLYMSPEQMRSSKQVDTRSDVYALGIILYECLSGVRPFRGGSYAELAALVLTGDAPPLDDEGLGLPPGLSLVVAQAMSVSPDARPPSVRALSEALAPFSPSLDFPWPVRDGLEAPTADELDFGTADDTRVSRGVRPAAPPPPVVAPPPVVPSPVVPPQPPPPPGAGLPLGLVAAAVGLLSFGVGGAVLYLAGPPARPEVVAPTPPGPTPGPNEAPAPPATPAAPPTALANPEVARPEVVGPDAGPRRPATQRWKRAGLAGEDE